MRGGARGDKYPEDFSGLLMELADMPVLETGAVKSVGVRIPRGPPSFGPFVQRIGRCTSKAAISVGVRVGPPVYQSGMVPTTVL